MQHFSLDSPLDSLLASFRSAIKPQIAEFRKSKQLRDDKDVFYRSDYSKTRLEPKQAEVDHKSPLTFRQLAYNFLTQEDVDLNNFNFADFDAVKELSKNFANYHSKNAKLRILSSEGNRYSWLHHRKKYGDISYKQFFKIKDKNDTNDRNLWQI
jgi:hypothetical protein